MTQTPIDWSKAPRGTTGAMVAHFDGENVRRGDVEFIPHDEPSRDEYDEGPEAWVYHPAPPSWNGEVLPPVGVVCEVNVGLKWISTKILAHHLGFAVHSWSEYGDDMEVQAAPPGDFRKSRTPQQIASEIRENAIAQMREITRVPEVLYPIGYDSAAILYDAGYRLIVNSDPE